jgi:L-ascorbate metabolism protein UlaG (beta-lactamase superfamily)
VSAGPQAGHDHLTWVGHGTVVVAMSGARVIVDPVLRPRILHLKRFHRIPAVALRGLDAVLITHQHHDHLDPPSIERLGKDLPVIVPRGAAGTLSRRRFTRVSEIAEGETVRIGGIEVLATPAAHDGKRDQPLGPHADPIGYRLDADRRVYVAGDTDLFDGMAAIGPVDAACLPISGWGPSLGPGHMDPVRAAEAAHRLAARIAVPIHWGTLWPIGRGTAPREPADAFAAAMAEAAPDCEARILEPGGTLALDGP